MNVNLSNKEKISLVSVLERFIPELRGEIASGVKHDWKMEMKKEKDILNGILDKLKGMKPS
ncbi:MAG: hypothetical protein ABFR82_00025 [Nitrospirota bacterium]